MLAKKYVRLILILTAMSTVMCQRNTSSAEAPVQQPSVTETPPQTQSMHVLTGRVTECSISADGYISFLLANPLTEETLMASRLTINGTEPICMHTGNAGNLLVCPLPSGTHFPVHIIVTVGEVTTDDFSYDGSACVVHPTPQTP